MKMSEESKCKAEDEIFRKHSLSYVEDGFYPTTKQLLFAAICNRKRFLEVPLNMEFLKKAFPVLILAVVMGSCTGGEKKDKDQEESQPVEQKTKKQNAAELESPANKSKYKSGDIIEVSVKQTDELKEIKQIFVFNEKEQIALLENGMLSFQWNTTESAVGNRNVKVEVKFAGGEKEIHRSKIILYPDEAPANYKFNIIKQYTHDKRAYTQGLVYENGFLYEGTGRWGGKSSIRKVIPETGEVIKIHTMSPQYFGEGISVLGNEIYQITYKKQVGFVYDKNSFQEIRQFNYSSSEGWGLTYDGEYFIMSNGSYILYYMEPEYFSEIKRLEVFDQNGPVANLNELEYINGVIFANIYQTNNIVMIEPGTGKVIGRANMKGLLTKSDMHPDIDVLNGIAYDAKNDRIFVTGKNWPKLYEVEFTK